MKEQSKAARRRYNDGLFHARYFVGDGIDVGGGSDSLARYVGVFPGLRSVRTWDRVDGDAQLLQGIDDGSFDFLHSSHCLEHLVDVDEGMHNWIRVVRPRGYVIVTVPDEDLYERGWWPSRFNADHKHTFTIYKPASWSPVSINILDLAKQCGEETELERVALHTEFYDENLEAPLTDPSAADLAECSIEMILRKRPFPQRVAEGMRIQPTPQKGGIR